jgi:hypothetical protein
MRGVRKMTDNNVILLAVLVNLIATDIILLRVGRIERRLKAKESAK